MSSDMEQGEAPELVNGLCGEAAGESWLSLLSHLAETLVVENCSFSVTELCTALSVVALLRKSSGKTCQCRFLGLSNY